MDFGKLSVAKKEIIEELNAKTKVLASAEPKGKLNMKKQVLENFKLSSSFIERFDMVFLLSDYRQSFTTAHYHKSALANPRTPQMSSSLISNSN